MFLAQLIWLEGGDMPSLRGRQHAKHLQTVSVFTNSTDASHSSDLEPEVWSPRSRSWYQDFVHAASQNSSRTSQDPTNDGHFTLSFMIEKSFLPVIYHRCSRILPISILLGLTAVLSPVFPWCSHPNSSAAPASLHCRTTHWDGSRDVVMRGWGFNSPGRGRKVRAVWNCEGVKTYWKLDLNQPKSGERTKIYQDKIWFQWSVPGADTEDLKCYIGKPGTVWWNNRIQGKQIPWLVKQILDIIIYIWDDPPRTMCLIFLGSLKNSLRVSGWF